MPTGSIRAGGLASGLDSDSIIQSVLTLQGASVDKINSKLTAVNVKVSTLGTIASKLQDLRDKSDELARNGVRGVVVSSKHTAFATRVESGATPGRFDVEIQNLATAARARSTAFASETATVAGGNLHLDINGAGFDIAIADGASLQDVAKSINESDASVTAAVLFDGTNAYLSVTRSSTGHTVGQPPGSALQLTMTTTGSTGQALDIGVVEEAQNTVALVDGLRFERQTTSIAGAIPGVTVEATAIGAKETVVVNDDTAKTSARLQGFVDAYNVLSSMLQSELNIKAETDRGKTLGGDSTLRFLQQRIQATVISQTGSGGVRTLADMGVKTGRDGKLSIDAAALNAAVARGGDDIDRVISQALAPAVKSVVEAFADKGGMIEARKDGLKTEKQRLEEDVVAQTARIDKLRDRLILQFSAMERIVSALNQTGNFLTSLSAQQERNK
jgi:flagellar hook-associated protein 2